MIPNEKIKLWTIKDKKEEKFLRRKTEVFDFKKHGKEDIRKLLERMKKVMKLANGIGLSANQIGFTYRIFIAQVPAENGGYKFYAIFNPEIEKPSKEKMLFEEGCLSIPGMYGSVNRPDKVTLNGFDKNGRALKIKAWGLLARVFQHEVDHLNGYLFIDRTKVLHGVETPSGTSQK